MERVPPESPGGDVVFREAKDGGVPPRSIREAIDIGSRLFALRDGSENKAPPPFGTGATLHGEFPDLSLTLAGEERWAR